ncbi:ATP-binding protein [Gordonia sp. SID5947]|uniref:sensor histidine kinase n=1 Tax=Gordonia sp. SID5947 TaxID=2690315 RepID=UPI0013720BB9|nr:ATP-binding protein [Gordonia sp. SID5947]MYR08749.1 ATP-binding protein [Gordonia sp. SID5947]
MSGETASDMVRGRLVGPSDVTDRARVQRVGSRFVGCGLLIFTAGLAPVMAARSELTDPWWPPLSAALVAGPALLVIGATYRPSVRKLTGLATLSSVAFLVAVALWFVAWDGDVAPDGSWWSVWLVQFPGVPGLLFGMAGRSLLAIGHIVVATFLAQTANQIGLAGHLRPEFYLGSLVTIALNCVFLAVAVVTVRTAGLLDETRAAAVTAAATSAAAMAKENERARFAALIHDKVIAILLAIDVGRPRNGLGAQAATALDELDRRDDELPEATLGVDEFAQRVRIAIAATDDDVGRELSISRAPLARYPRDVVSGMVEAMCEAIRNTRRHAGAGASRLVVGDFRADRVTVAIADDGEGFDPVRVPPERLGVEVGIRRRMAALAGGDAEIRSAPGRGTVVVLTWTRDVEG